MGRPPRAARIRGNNHSQDRLTAEVNTPRSVASHQARHTRPWPPATLNISIWVNKLLLAKIMLLLHSQDLPFQSSGLPSWRLLQHGSSAACRRGLATSVRSVFITPSNPSLPEIWGGTRKLLTFLCNTCSFLIRLVTEGLVKNFWPLRHDLICPNPASRFGHAPPPFRHPFAGLMRLARVGAH